MTDSIRASEIDAEAIVKDFIQQYGVPGMKWGKRKARSSSGSRSKTRNRSADYEQSRRIKKKRPNQRSNREMETLNRRRQLEKRSSELNPNTIRKGNNAAKAILATAGTLGSLYALTKTPAGRAATNRGRAFVQNNW